MRPPHLIHVKGPSVLDEVIKLFRHAAVYGLGQIVGKIVVFLLDSPIHLLPVKN